jgi:quercetin dioxygenase-like cupin family protein
MTRTPRRHRIAAAAFLVVLAALTALPLSARSQSQSPKSETNMQLFRNGSRPSQPGPADWFTGSVRIDPLYTAEAPSRVGAAQVTFEPGARTAWHTHPLGQILVVTSGTGWTQCEGEPVVEIRAGDVIWCPPGHRHWHGATATTAMTHIAIQEALNGSPVTWMEKVSDEQYAVGSAAQH